MPLRRYKATSPGRRFLIGPTFEEITTSKPHRPLLEPKTRISGRNDKGRLTVRHRGGGAKRAFRRIDFRRDKWGVPARLATIEYDPNRSARIGLLHYADGEKRYMLVPNGLEVGAQVVAGPDAEARVGNALPLKNIPLGTTIHNVELVPGHVGPAAGQGRPVRAGPPALGRGPARRHALHGDRRPGGQRRPREPEPRQGRASPPPWPPAADARRGDDPA
jgi:large subunit ribosomal protein L2